MIEPLITHILPSCSIKYHPKSASLHAKASKTPQNVNILLITASPTFKRQTRLFDE